MSDAAEATELPAGLTVLLVEPQKFLSGILRNALISAGVYTDNILEVQTATKALELLKTRVPDVILTELNLPDTDGDFMIRRARESGITVPILVVTSEAYEYKVREALAAGVNDFLVKPISQLVISRRIARALRTAFAPPAPLAAPRQANLSNFTL